MKTVCPLCQRMVNARRASDGCDILPNHGHKIMRGMHTGGMGCKASGFSVQGIEILRTWINAFGLLRNRT